jgi:hypothetical protein
MKTQTSFKTLLLLVLLVAAGSFSQRAMAQEDTCAVNVIHTYMNGRLVPWDSVEVKVCLSPCQPPYHYRTFKMYWPDTILSNCATRIDEYVAADRLELSQNYPNPCQGESRVNLTTRTAGSVKLQVMDVQGRLCCQRTEMLPAGEHQLSITLPHGGVYFVQAETNEGSKVSKVLCTEGRGSGFDLRVVSSSSPQLMEKAERGGGGMFGMTDYMRITAYITHNGIVRNSAVIVNTTYELEGHEFSIWMYEEGAINIFMNDIDSNAQLELAGNTFQLIVSSQTCLPFIDIPLGYTITFCDSTFYSIPEAFSLYTSSTWHFNGWYKYRQFGDLFYVCSMDDTLPDFPPSLFDRSLIITSNRDAIIYTMDPYLSGKGYERLILSE